MQNGKRFKEKLRSGQVCLGSCVSFTDPTVSEVLGASLDYLWIDMEHGPLNIETVQAHIMAAELAGATALIRVPWNDPIIIKRVLDVGAAGVIVPMVNTAAEAKQAVAACHYPPSGIRGYGPRRASNYGRQGGPDYFQSAFDDTFVAVQIEHVNGVNNLDEILQVPGLDAVMVGPADLSISMGRQGQTTHPDVVQAIETVVAKARGSNVAVGMYVGDDPQAVVGWIRKGVQWVAVGVDFYFLMRAIERVVKEVRQGLECEARS